MIDCLNTIPISGSEWWVCRLDSQKDSSVLVWGTSFVRGKFPQPMEMRLPLAFIQTILREPTADSSVAHAD